MIQAKLQHNNSNYKINYPKTPAQVILTQMKINKPLKMQWKRKWRDVDEIATIVYTTKSIARDEWAHQRKKIALKNLVFIKEKLYGTFKARGCADARSQFENTV